MIFFSLLDSMYRIEYISGEIREKSEFMPSISGVPNILLGNNGSPICLEIHDQMYLDVCGDDDEGCILVWVDFRDGPYTDLYAQRMDGNGNVLWGVNGTPICLEEHDQKYAKLCSDEEGGALITWMDYRSGQPHYEIFAQRVNSTGDIQWDVNGTAICT
ncbi:MAG: hypothetical protein JSV62_02245, partial [Promethearchaeota archaeon]